VDGALSRYGDDLEARRQIMHLVGMARGKTFDPAENDRFLELNGVIVQELGVILASGEFTSPRMG